MEHLINAHSLVRHSGKMLLVAVLALQLGVLFAHRAHVGVVGADLYLVPPTNGSILVGDHDLLATLSMQRSTISQQESKIDRLADEHATQTAQISTLQQQLSELLFAVSAQTATISEQETKLERLAGQLQTDVLFVAGDARTIDGEDGVNVGVFSSLALTTEGVPVISYQDLTNQNLKLAVCNNVLCTMPTIRTVDSAGAVGKGTSLALTSVEDHPVISYYDETNSALKLAVCHDFTCSNVTLLTIAFSGDVGSFNSLALTLHDDHPVITYYDAEHGDLKLAVCGDTTCTNKTTRTVDSEENVGASVELALTSNDIPVIAYRDVSNANLKLAMCDDATCSTATIRTIDSVGLHLSLALTSHGHPIIAYYSATNADLLINVCANAACTASTIRTVDSAGMVGRYVSLDLTRSDDPVISYHDGTNMNLKMTVCADTTCYQPMERTISRAGDVGRFTALKVSPRGNALISFYDDTNTALKLVHVDL
eukprot:m.12554 g.12554  ORF g.12554 m.12554 type:complete len:483 (-) comp5834_c0_seq2:2309-3757(-)